MKIEIKNASGIVLFACEAATLKEAVIAAVKTGANLNGADLGGENLRLAYLAGANLYGANLRSANLSGANLNGADFRLAYLAGADFSWANLREADFGGAYLSGADFRLADLGGAKNADLALAETSIVPEDGPFFGWKKCQDNVLVKVAIGAKAKRSNASGRKCRAEYVKVLEVIGADVGVSMHDRKTEYRVGQIVRCDKWDDDRWKECSGGIHFFLTKEEAQAF